MEPPVVSPSVLQIQEFKESKSIKAMRSFRSHFIQPPPWAGFFLLLFVFSFLASAWFASCEGKLVVGATALPSLDTSYY